MPFFEDSECCPKILNYTLAGVLYMLYLKLESKEIIKQGKEYILTIIVTLFVHIVYCDIQSTKMNR